jgi:hypothetical protein
MGHAIGRTLLLSKHEVEWCDLLGLDPEIPKPRGYLQ